MVTLKKKISKTLVKQHLPETVFLGITIISVVVLIVPLWDYNQFYNALYNFSYTIPGVSINTSQLSARTAQINFTVVATNPTGYSGLQVASVMCEVDYYNGTAWSPLTTFFTTKGYTLSPYSNTMISFSATINPISANLDQFDAFNGFISYLTTQVPGGQIVWSLTCNLALASFLVGSSFSLTFTPVTTLS